jgi:DNA helicase-2/ATP-dependent DNA helicase PcrA
MGLFESPLSFKEVGQRGERRFLVLKLGEENIRLHGSLPSPLAADYKLVEVQQSSEADIEEYRLTNPPVHEALGYGKSVHDVMAEIHKRAIDGDIVSGLDANDLVDKHLNTPFAYPGLRADLRRAAIRAVRRYVEENRTWLENTLYSEQQIQVRVAPGITVDGRIDLITRLDTGETSIVDFKSTERAQAEDITRDQLHVYAVGYQELTGRRADVLEVLNLDEKGKTTS